MSDIEYTNDNLNETSFILGATYNDQSYSSDTPDEVALLVTESSDYIDISVSKTGDSETVETPNDGANAAVKVSDSGTAVYIKGSTIQSECNNSQGVYCTEYANVTIENTEINSIGDNNTGIVSNTFGNIEIKNGIISTSGENSAAIYAGENSGTINVSANISTFSDAVLVGEYPDYVINLNNSSVYGSSYLGKFSKSGEVNIKGSTISTPIGFDFTPKEDILDRTNFITYIQDGTINVTDTLFNLSNTDFYISIKGNEDVELANTLANLTNGSKGTIAIREQKIEGNINVDESSAIRMTISDNSEFIGAFVKTSETNVEGNNFRMNLSRSKWTLTADTFLTELIVDGDSVIDLNNFTLTVNDISSDYQVGYVVNYKSEDGEIKQDNLVIIKVNEDGTYNLYDTDDYVTYNDASTSEITFTARVLDNIDEILADIDERAKTSQTTEGLEDGITVVVNGTSDTNGIRIDTGVIEHTDITVIKSGDTKVETPTVHNTISNAAVLVTNGATFTYHSSSVTTSANYSAGLVVDQENSQFITTNIEVTTNSNNSTGVLAINGSTFSGNDLTIATSGEASNGVQVDNARLTLNNSSIDVSGEDAVGVLIGSNSNNVLLNGLNINSGDYTVYVSDNSSAQLQNSILNNGIYVTDSSTLQIDYTTIDTEGVPAYTVEGSGFIYNSNNNITVDNNNAVLIKDSNPCTVTLVNDTITNTGDFSTIYVENSVAYITIDNSVINTEDIMLRSTNSTIYLTIAGNVTGDIYIDPDSVLYVTIDGNYTGLINNEGVSGEVNVTITPNGKWTLSTGKDSYVYSLYIEDGDNTRVVYNGTSRLFVNDESFVNRNDVPIDIDSGYSTKLYPTQRTLKVCKAEDLPDRFDRDKNYMYLVYDKMELYIYQSRYSDPFCIVEQLPANKAEMTDKMVYITTDGYIYCYMNYKAYQLGTVENFDPVQLETLHKCGTTYFMNAESRYIDPQKRTIQLPFQNGNYQLNLSLFEDIMINEDTVIRFDPETEQFYIAGREYQFDNKLNNIHAYSGASTSTVKNKIDRHTFRSEVRISDKAQNSIQSLKNGLYVSTFDLAKMDDYDRMITAFAKYKIIIDNYINELKELVGEATEYVSPQAVAAKVREALEAYEPTINSMFANYETLSNRLSSIENTLATGLPSALESAKEEIKAFVNETNSAWEQVYGDYQPEFTEIELEARALAISEIRSQFVQLRSTTDPEEERIGSYGEIYDVGYALNGLSEDETSVQVYILNRISSIGYNMQSWIIKESFEELPEYGEEWYRYFIIKADENNPVYQEYKWYATYYTYDAELEEMVEVPAHYRLIYDCYHPEDVVPEPDPVPEPMPEPEPEPEPEPDPEP